MIHGTETEYSSKMAIELDGSMFGTNTGSTDQIEMSRNLSHNEITSFSLPKPCEQSWLYDAAVSGTAVPTLPISSAATRGCSRVRPLSRAYV